jgi:hypothetical protein
MDGLPITWCLVTRPIVPKLRLGMPTGKLGFLSPYQSVTTLINPSCPA